MKNQVKLFVLFLMTVAFLMPSCKKKEATPLPKIKTITYTPGGNVETYSYDSQGRIIKITSSGLSSYTGYEYKGTDSIIEYTITGTDSVRKVVYKLNGVGQAIVVNDPTAFGYTEVNTYDVNGFLQYTSTTGAFGSSSNDTFTVASNNVTLHSRGGGSLLGYSYTRQNYSYLPDKINTVTNETKGMSFLGKTSVNLINTELYYNYTTFPSVTTTNVTYSYTYEFGANNWVSKMIKTNVSTSETSTESYTYY